MKPLGKIKRLAEVFDRNLDAYKSSGYKEANVRSEFIEPFFEELGWDVRNLRGWGWRICPIPGAQTRKLDRNLSSLDLSSLNLTSIQS